MKQTAIVPNALKLWFVPGMISLALMFSLSLFACESFNEALFGNSAANTYSNTSETGLVYTFYNNSSVSIIIEDSTGSVTIPSGGSQQVRYNRSITIYSVNYSPTSVKVEQAGSGFFFKD